MKDLKDTVDMMNSADYRERFKAEYEQVKIRYEKLKAFNNKIEAGRMMRESEYACNHASGEKVEAYDKPAEPVHDCPDYLLRDQQRTMGEYLHILEIRAVIEHIDLND